MTDEQQIGELIATWIAATRDKDVDTVLSLMTDDVVFLVAGQPPMLKADFAKAARGQAAPGGPAIDGQSEIEELIVAGDWAFVRTKLTITVRPPIGAAIHRAGHTLTIMQKQNGKWLLARDANLLVTVAK